MRAMSFLFAIPLNIGLGLRRRINLAAAKTF